MKEREIVERMLASFESQEKLEAMTNAELADVLMNKVWANMELFTPESDLIGAVIDRLRGEE